MINLHTSLLGQADEQELYFMLHVAGYMNKENFAFPAVKTLAKEMRWEERKVRRVKQRCIEKGFIEAVARYRENGGRTSDGYRVLTDCIGVYTPLKGKGHPTLQDGEGGTDQRGEGDTLRDGEGGTPQDGEGKEVLPKEVLPKEERENPASEKIQTDYTVTASRLISFLNEDDAGQMFLSSMRDVTKFRGDITEPVTDYCRKLSEEGEFYKLTVPTDPGAFQKWFARMRGGIERYMKAQVRFKKGDATTYTPPVTTPRARQSVPVISPEEMARIREERQIN